MIIATSYFPPVWYIKEINATDKILIDHHEHFVKQSIRNRAHILSPNGIQSLIIPVVHHKRNISPMKDIRISNDINWQRQHWRSLCSAYQRSAFFEFYQDDLVLFYEKKYEFLTDFNQELLRFILMQLHIKSEIEISSGYQEPSESLLPDFREACNSGQPVVTENQKSYPQVFSYKNGFTGGLSIADLLFNIGPRSVDYLK